MKLAEIVDVINEERVRNTLMEDFQRDVNEYRSNRLLRESLLREGIFTEQELDEGFFGNVKRFAAKLKDAWQQAKDEGDEEELKKIEAKYKALQAKVAANKNRNNKTTEPTKTDSEVEKDTSSTEQGTDQSNSPTTQRVGKSEPTADQNPTQGSSDETKKEEPSQSDGDKKAVAQKGVKQVVEAMKKNDPKNFQKLVEAAKKGAKYLAQYLKHPKIQGLQKKVSGEVSQETSDNPKKQGLLGKMGSWAKKHPIKAGIGIALIGTIGVAAGIGSGGIAPLLTSTLLAAAKGGAMGAMAGGIGSGIKQAAADYNEKGSVDWKGAGKAALKGAKTGAMGGAIGAAAGNVLGKAAMGAKDVASHIGGEPSAAELMQSKHKALHSLGMSNDSRQATDLDDKGNFSVKTKDGATHYFHKDGSEVTDPNEIDQFVR